MKSAPRAAVMFIALAVSQGAAAGDFSDPFDRVQEVWDNVSSFHDKAWTAINDMLSSGSADSGNTFFNTVAPQEISDASKIAIKQIFPQLATPINVADDVDKWASRWASKAQDNAQTNLDSPKGSDGCAIFTGGICPPCAEIDPNTRRIIQVPSDSHGNCPDSGLEDNGSDAKYLAQSGANLQSALNAFSLNSPAAIGPAQASSSITATDLASIGASNTSATPSTSLAQDAEQVRQELAAIEQQRAAAAAAAAEAVRQQAILQQIARQQAADARRQAAQAAAQAQMQTAQATRPAAPAAGRSPTDSQPDPPTAPEEAFAALGTGECIYGMGEYGQDGKLVNKCPWAYKVRLFIPSCRPNGCVRTLLPNGGSVPVESWDSDSHAEYCPYPFDPRPATPNPTEGDPVYCGSRIVR